jgi:hypothetical protein
MARTRAMLLGTLPEGATGEPSAPQFVGPVRVKSNETQVSVVS